MSRLTRCPACTTVFRVTDEQLDSRQGFVRCGQCAKVFDARASLMEERGPEPASPDAAETPGGAFPSGDASVAGAHEAAETSFAAPHVAIDAAPAAPAAGPADDAPPAASATTEEDGDPFEGMDVEEIVLSLDEPDADAAEPDQPSPQASHPPAGDAPAMPAAADAAVAATAAAAVAPATPAPLRPAVAADVDEPLPFGPKHRARSRAAAFAWGAGALMLLALLAAQAAYWFRAELAMAFPEARPYLELGCRHLACTVPPPRQIALLSIESSELQVDKNVPGLLTLNATLRNRAAFAQTHPSIELTLTDADDRPLSRRVLAPADYLGDRLAREPLFPAVSEYTVRLHIDATAFRPTGYRLFLFHP